MTGAVSLTAAAASLDVSAATVRRWIRQGAPCARQGDYGRGHSARVVVAEIAAWRARRAVSVSAPGEPERIDQIAQALLDTLMCDAGQGEPAHVALGISRRQAAALLALAFERIGRAVTGHDIESLPAQIVQLRTVCLSSSGTHSPETSRR